VSAIFTPPTLSKVSSFFSKRNPLDTLDSQRVRYFQPPPTLSKVSSFFSKRNPLDTLDKGVVQSGPLVGSVGALTFLSSECRRQASLSPCSQPRVDRAPR
jgi:hypothetical protein